MVSCGGDGGEGGDVVMATWREKEGCALHEVGTTLKSRVVIMMMMMMMTDDDGDGDDVDGYDEDEECVV